MSCCHPPCPACHWPTPVCVTSPPTGEEDPAQFRPIAEPPALDQYLISNQVANYCDQIGHASGQAMSKMYVMQALQHGQRFQ